MAIKTRVGFVSGTTQAPSLLVTVFDDAGGTLGYVAARDAAIAAAPTNIFGGAIDLESITVNDRSHDAISFDIGYRGAALTTVLVSDGATTPEKELYNFIDPVGVYGVGGADLTSSYSAFKWKPNRQGSAAEFNSGKPVIVRPLQVGPRFRFNTSQSFVNDDYVDLVCDMVERGVFNNAIYLGRAVGTMQLVEFSIEQLDYAAWQLVFGFGVKPFQASVAVGDGVIIPELRGCDHYWPIEVETYTDGKIQPIVEAAVVGQAWPFDDFGKLNLPWQSTLTTRSSDTAGVVTTVYEHNIDSSDTVNIIWPGGTRTGNVTATGANTVTFSSGSGDALPPLSTNLLIAKQAV